MNKKLFFENEKPRKASVFKGFLNVHRITAKSIGEIWHVSDSCHIHHIVSQQSP